MKTLRYPQHAYKMHISYFPQEFQTACWIKSSLLKVQGPLNLNLMRNDLILTTVCPLINPFSSRLYSPSSTFVNLYAAHINQHHSLDLVIFGLTPQNLLSLYFYYNSYIIEILHTAYIPKGVLTLNEISFHVGNVGIHTYLTYCPRWGQVVHPLLGG